MAITSEWLTKVAKQIQHEEELPPKGSPHAKKGPTPLSLDPLWLAKIEKHAQETAAKERILQLLPENVRQTLVALWEKEEPSTPLEEYVAQLLGEIVLQKAQNSEASAHP